MRTVADTVYCPEWSPNHPPLGVSVLLLSVAEILGFSASLQDDTAVTLMYSFPYCLMARNFFPKSVHVNDDPSHVSA